MPGNTICALAVVALAAVDEAVHVPAHVAPDVVLQASLGELVRLRGAVHARQDQALHRERLAVVRELLQDLVRHPDALLVLLQLVELNHLVEVLLVLGRKRRRAVRGGRHRERGGSEDRRPTGAIASAKGRRRIAQILSRHHAAEPENHVVSETLE